MTTAQAFDQFAKRIQPTATQRLQIKRRFERANEYLQGIFTSDSALALRDAIPMGSAARETAIRPITDIDLLAVFANKDNVFERYRRDSQTFLYRIRQAIKDKTQIRQVGSRGQAVRLFYTDGLHVDIAPVFRRAEGGYRLPSGDGSWLATDPPKQTQWINQRDRDLNNLLKRRVRFLKRWNNEHSQRLGSWHLEVMVARMYSGMSRDSREVIEKFFEWAPGYLTALDPDGYGGDLSTGLTWNVRQAVRESFARAHDQAQRANAAEQRGNNKEAIRLWTVILGDEFPAYSGS
jgi:Second Messenger Oligonucleotide or Dinucleotide Synthetase domain